jgi:hypothetical protein
LAGRTSASTNVYGSTAADQIAAAAEDGPAVSIDLSGNDTDLAGANHDLEIQSIDTTGTLGAVTINADNDSVVIGRLPGRSPEFEDQRLTPRQATRIGRPSFVQPDQLTSAGLQSQFD